MTSLPEISMKLQGMNKLENWTILLINTTCPLLKELKGSPKFLLFLSPQSASHSLLAFISKACFLNNMNYIIYTVFMPESAQLAFDSLFLWHFYHFSHFSIMMTSEIFISRTVVLNIPNDSTLQFISSYCGDPPKCKIIFIVI